MIAIQTDSLAALDSALENTPNDAAVFLVWPREGRPYLGRTGLLRRRLLRLLRPRDKPSRILNLRSTVARIEYWLTGSSLESSLRMYSLAREHFPDEYAELIRLRMPHYVKIVLSNQFPRSHVTSHLSRSGAAYYGPFRARATAERFEAEMLNLFQMRRCQEDLAPSPEHPGCIYGEMAMCLRPCQHVVGPEEYGHEVGRVLQFLESDGRSLEENIGAARDRCSEEMDFEEAARQHKRLEKLAETLKFRDEMARDLDHLHGVAVAPSAAASAVELFVVRSGWLQQPRTLRFEVEEGKPVSLDLKLRECLADLAPLARTIKERAETMALLSRWFYSSWRDGEWIPYRDPEQAPYRKLVHAVSRVARRS